MSARHMNIYQVRMYGDDKYRQYYKIFKHLEASINL